MGLYENLEKHGIENLYEMFRMVSKHIGEGDDVVKQACDELLAMYDEVSLSEEHTRAAFIDRLKEASSYSSWEPSESSMSYWQNWAGRALAHLEVLGRSGQEHDEMRDSLQHIHRTGNEPYHPLKSYVLGVDSEMKRKNDEDPQRRRKRSNRH